MLIVQVHPREFSTIIGPEICAVLVVPPVRPLPLLPLPFPTVPYDPRPPDMTAAPPIPALLRVYLFSPIPWILLARRCADRLRLYLRAMKNMAAPYAAAPPTAANAIPAVALLVPVDVFCESVLKTPPFEFVVLVAAAPAPAPAEAPPFCV